MIKHLLGLSSRDTFINVPNKERAPFMRGLPTPLPFLCFTLSDSSCLFFYDSLCVSVSHCLLEEECGQNYTSRQTPTASYPFHSWRTTLILPPPCGGRLGERREEEGVTPIPACMSVCVCAPLSRIPLDLTSTFNWLQGYCDRKSHDSCPPPDPLLRLIAF